jgi:hypothetical protein
MSWHCFVLALLRLQEQENPAARQEKGGRHVDAAGPQRSPHPDIQIPKPLTDNQYFCDLYHRGFRRAC